MTSRSTNFNMFVVLVLTIVLLMLSAHFWSSERTWSVGLGTIAALCLTAVYITLAGESKMNRMQAQLVPIRVRSTPKRMIR